MNTATKAQAVPSVKSACPAPSVRLVTDTKEREIDPVVELLIEERRATAEFNACSEDEGSDTYTALSEKMFRRCNDLIAAPANTLEAIYAKVMAVYVWEELYLSDSTYHIDNLIVSLKTSLETMLANQGVGPKKKPVLNASLSAGDFITLAGSDVEYLVGEEHIENFVTLVNPITNKVSTYAHRAELNTKVGSVYRYIP